MEATSKSTQPLRVSGVIPEHRRRPASYVVIRSESPQPITRSIS